jgi:hypothetical protein
MCHAVFVKMDLDGSGTLDRKEFEQVMMVLFGNVLLPVIFQYSVTLLIGPLLAPVILNGIGTAFRFTVAQLSQLDQYHALNVLFHGGLVILATIWHVLWHRLILSYTPTMLQTMAGFLMRQIGKIPDSIWNMLPLTFLSTILALVVVPHSLMKIDDFFKRSQGQTAVVTDTIAALSGKKFINGMPLNTSIQPPPPTATALRTTGPTKIASKGTTSAPTASMTRKSQKVKLK